MIFNDFFTILNFAFFNYEFSIFVDILPILHSKIGFWLVTIFQGTSPLVNNKSRLFSSNTLLRFFKFSSETKIRKFDDRFYVRRNAFGTNLTLNINRLSQSNLKNLEDTIRIFKRWKKWRNYFQNNVRNPGCLVLHGKDHTMKILLRTGYWYRPLCLEVCRSHRPVLKQIGCAFIDWY